MKQNPALGHSVAIGTFALFLASADFVPDWIYASSVKLSSDSRPFDIVFKPERLLFLLSAFIAIRHWLGWQAPRSGAYVRFKVAGTCALGAALALIGPAIAAGFVRFDAKLPSVSLVWALNNFHFVCAVEEILFRGYLQEGLQRWSSTRYLSKSFPIVISSVLFGLAHLRVSPTFAALAGIAGVFYGVAYARAGIFASILTHFSVNGIHLFFFSYPSLSR